MDYLGTLRRRLRYQARCRSFPRFDEEPKLSELLAEVRALRAEVFEAATTEADNASTHLRRAWGYAFGRNPEPGPAYQEAVAALEATFDAIVVPNDPATTLGKIEKALKDKPSKWAARLTDDQDADSGVLAVRAGLRVIWRSQERHGSSQPGAPTSCTLEEAQDAVVMAAA